jgi:hypothetical protein
MGAYLARAGAVALALLLASAHAIAFPTSRLTYARAAGAEACPEETTVRQAVAARLGYDPFFAAADKTIVARILRSREELRATVELVDNRGIVRGVREFKAPAGQCDELVATMALAISIAIDPSNPGILGDAPKARPEPPRVEPASLDRPAPPPSVAPAEAAPSPEAVVPPKPAAERLAIELRLGAAAVGAVGTAPAPTAGLALSAGVRRGIWSINLEGHDELPGSTDAGPGSVRTSRWAGGIAPCLHFDPGLICATTWLGSLRADGVGFADSRTRYVLYAAAGLRLGLEVPISAKLTFRPEFEFVANLFPVDLQVDAVTQWSAPPFAALLRMGLLAHFP